MDTVETTYGLIIVGECTIDLPNGIEIQDAVTGRLWFLQTKQIAKRTVQAVDPEWVGVHFTGHLKTPDGHYLASCPTLLGMDDFDDCADWRIADTTCPFCYASVNPSITPE